MRGMSPFIFVLQYWLIKFIHRLFFSPSNIPSSLPPPTMNATLTPPTQVWCPGCEKGFTPCSLSQHVSRTQDLRCCRVVATSRSHLASTAFPHMGSPPTLCSTWAPQVAGEDALGNEYNKPAQGEFAVTHVATCAAVLQNFFRWRWTRPRWDPNQI